MRFSITLPDDLTDRIDEAAERAGITRAEWIRQACCTTLDAAAPPTPPDAPQTAPDMHQPGASPCTTDAPHAHQDDIARLTDERDQALRDLVTLRERAAGLQREIGRLEAHLQDARETAAALTLRAERDQVLLQQAQRLLPAARTGAIARVKAWLFGPEDLQQPG